MLSEGKSAAEIQRELNKRSGLNLTGAPESSIGWMLPVGLLIGAAGILALVIVRFRKNDEMGETQQASRKKATEREAEGGDDEEDGASANDDELEARLRRELEDDD